ncbi:MAG: ABC transporter ATP-binding protein, partial [Clostridium sp.]|nr:ABC transporter ATP-binding protein [Clostridium sp.]
KFGFLLGGKIKEAANQLIADYNIVSLNSDQSMQMLSGGNMQKIVVAREISSDPNILIANQPTRGIDVGA